MEATVAATRMQSVQQQQQQQGEPNFVEDGPDLGGQGMAMGRGKKVIAKESNDDDWGGEAIGSDLLPGM